MSKIEVPEKRKEAMGSVLSAIRGATKTVGAVTKLLLDLNKQYQALLVRVNAPPGLPHANPSSSYWLDEPPFPELVDARSASLPREADVVIIGSGITGAAVARSLYTASTSSAAATAAADGSNEQGSKKGPRVVVLEARSLCAGATGRNGGHVKASPHELFPRLARYFGKEGAARLTRFALRTAEAVLEVGGEAGREVAECRRVETVDFFLDEKGFEDGKREVEELRRWVPEVEIAVLGREETEARFGVEGGHVAGGLVYKAGAMWPYRLVAKVWRELVDECGGRLSLEMNTAVEEVTMDVGGGDGGGRPYVVRTERGAIRARHVVHATNAHAGQFLPGLRGKMAGVKAHMTAQRPSSTTTTTTTTSSSEQSSQEGEGGFRWRDGSRTGSRSWSILYGGGAFDYVTQRPNGDVMLGGGFARSAGEGADMVGVYDDSGTDGLTIAHVSGVMSAVFGARWRGDVTKVWSGVLGVTGDMAPFVGRVPASISGAKGGKKDSSSSSSWFGLKRGEREKDKIVKKVAKVVDEQEEEEDSWKGAEAGQWVSAGYCGDGMVWAWLCGTALGVMIAGQDDVVLEKGVGFPGGKLGDWFPKELLITEARVKKADMSNLVDEIM
ncbi:FAD dependent oxidoreductase [Colletotrichum orchidophilum]|uniref:FAD dependent oxidoreductase n=1 Tax=Colletotrichum orchidophilum TaxID=1209926 RepID=A0A1G4BLZ8_9PEZI|nr:FAD dependent oxidoreductase [Colletotrichum orchidophilum]OHF02355.1 FAD dependent oxidoreductase [Colletotrichum orchidophilum]